MDHSDLPNIPTSRSKLVNQRVTLHESLEPMSHSQLITYVYLGESDSLYSGVKRLNVYLGYVDALYSWVAVTHCMIWLVGNESL